MGELARDVSNRQAGSRMRAVRTRRHTPSDVGVAAPWRASTVATALVVAASGVVIAAWPHHSWDFHHLPARVSIDTATGIGIFAAAWLASLRYKHDRSAASWLLMTGLDCYAFTALLAFVLPAAFPLDGFDATGAPLAGWLLASIPLVAAAFVRRGPMRRPPSMAATVEFAIAVSAACAAVGAVLADRFPHVVIGDFNGPAVGIDHAAPIFIGVTAATAALYVLCGVTLWTRALAANDTTLGWLGIAVVFVGCGRLDALLLASVSPSLVSVGDLVKLAATAALIAASAAEFHRFEQRLTDAVSAHERRRLALELHDGLAQDLAFVSTQASSVARRGGDPHALREIASAADRAMADSRRAIHLLNRPRSRAVSTALAERAYELCARSGLQLEFAMLGGEVHATPNVEHAVLQIVSEAVTNAAKHSGASTVTVELASSAGAFSVRVSDDGCGFDPHAAARVRRRLGGFGLTSMAERARAFGGELHVHSDPSRAGTTVEVMFR
jgi:signal transduction histidine kinase